MTATAGAGTPNIALKHRTLPKWSNRPLSDERNGQAATNSSHTAFAGRWLLVTAGGDCLVDYFLDACDAVKEIPLGAGCSLIAAILQFVVAARGLNNQDSSTAASTSLSIHSVLLSGVRFSICRASKFSVVAVTDDADPIDSSEGLDYAPAKRNHIATDAAILHKAIEAHVALSAHVGDALSDLADVSARQREGKLNSYTLDSMLDSQDSTTGQSMESFLQPTVRANIHGIFSSVLNQSYAEMLRLALRGLEGPHRHAVDSICIFDEQLSLLARLFRTAPVSQIEAEVEHAAGTPHAVDEFAEISAWHGSELMRAVAVAELRGSKKLRSDPESGAASDSVSSGAKCWCWSQDASRTLRVHAVLGSPGGNAVSPLRVGVQLCVGRGPTLTREIPLEMEADPMDVVQIPLEEGAVQPAELQATCAAVEQVRKELCKAFSIDVAKE